MKRIPFFRIGRPVWLGVILFTFTTLVPAADTGQPYQGRWPVVPGRIEAEHWDEGAAGVAYHDIDEPNRGVDYREKTQVDIEKRSDASNGHGLGWTKEGEWVTYSVEVRQAGLYTIFMPVASNKQGGLFHIEIAGQDITGPIQVPDTGGWQILRLIAKRDVRLPKGRHVLKVVMDRNGPSSSIADIDYFEFQRTGD